MYQKEKKKRNNQNAFIDEAGRLMPQALDFEAAVVGALLIEQEAFSLVCDLLTPDSFYDVRNRLVYQAILQLNKAHQPIDLLTVTEQLRSTGELENAGGAYYLATLSEDMVSSAHIEYHAKIVAQKHLSRQLIHLAANMQRNAFDETVDIDDLLDEAASDIFDLSQKNRKRDIQELDDVLVEAFEMLKKAAAKTDGMSGIQSGFHEIDAVTAGWQNSDLIIIAARPAMGKTAFVLSMAANMAIDYQIPVGLFSLEMSNVQLVNRLISNVCEIDSYKIRSGQLSTEEWKQLDYRMNRMFKAPLYLDDTANLSVLELRSKARQLVSEHGVKLIIIDYLQLMNASGMNTHSRQEEVSTISRNLKILAKELNIPIIVLSQLNRELEKRTGQEGKKPQLSDLRESGAIEQDADMVCFIHRPEVFGLKMNEKGEDMTNRGLFIIAKHRNGQLKDVELYYKKEFTKFMNMSDAALWTAENENGMQNILPPMPPSDAAPINLPF